jgi:hypothetical protein
MGRMKFYGLCEASAVILSVLVCAGTALADPKGLWLAQDGARVRVGPCGGTLCATIAAPKSHVDPETGLPWTDKNNPDPAQRNRPLVGVAVMYSLVPDGAGKWTDASTTSTTVKVMPDISSNSTRERSGSKAAPLAFAAARI